MRIPLAVVSLVVAALGLAACGENQYDAGKVESILQQTQKDKLRGLPMGDATCPKDVKLSEGVTFQCTLVIAGEQAPYKVTLTNVKADKVTVTAEPAKALVATKAVLGRDLLAECLPVAKDYLKRVSQRESVQRIAADRKAASPEFAAYVASRARR